MAETNVFYFDIPGISCSSCKENIERKLNSKNYIEAVGVYVLSKRAKVITKKGVTPEKILEDIKSCGEKFSDSTVYRQKYVVYCSVQGLLNPQLTNQLREFLNNAPNYVKSYELHYSTKTLKLELVSGNDLVKLNQLLHSNPQLKDLKLTAISVPKAQMPRRSLAKKYFRNAIVNGMIGIPLWLIGFMGLIPSPLTLVGQLVGLGIGGVILGAMHVSGKGFYKDAWDQFKNQHSYNMNTLIALGTGSAWVYSMIIALFPFAFPVASLHYEFLAVNMILGIVNLGKGIRERLQDKTRNQVKSIEDMFLELHPQQVTKVTSEFQNLLSAKMLGIQTKQVNFKKIEKHDVLIVGTGERIPVEGIIVGLDRLDRRAQIDQSTLSGESRLLNKQVGDEVFSGSLNKGDPIYIKASKKGTESNLYKLIEDAVHNTSVNNISMSGAMDKLAKYFVPSVIAVAFLTGVGWLLLGPGHIAPMVQSVLSVFLCACPCSWLLATPITMTITIYKLFVEGILVHNADSIERAAYTTAVVFDKTGTLTQPAIKEVKSLSSWQNSDILRYVTSLEGRSNHPIAQSFENTANNNLEVIEFTPIEDGIQGILKDSEGRSVPIKVSSHLHMNVANQTQQHHEEVVSNWQEQGYTHLYVAIGQPYAESSEKPSNLNFKLVGMIALEHHLREDAKWTVDKLRESGKELFILSGDNEAANLRVGRELGIPKENIFFNVKADDKPKKIDIIREGRTLQINNETVVKKGHKNIAMIGDGANDIKAFRKVTGISMGPWTEASTSADIAIHKLSHLTKLFKISKLSMRNIFQNLSWTAVYNIPVLLIATGCLYFYFGFVMPPVMASVFMSLSSILVVFNSSRLTGQIDDVINDEHQERNSWLNTFSQAFQNPYQVVQNFRSVIDLESENSSTNSPIIILDDEDSEPDNIMPNQRAGGSMQVKIEPGTVPAREIKQEPMDRPIRIRPG